jgi:hypothetical protein
MSRKDDTMANKAATPPDAEELILYAALLVIGAIPAAVAVLERHAFDCESTVGLMMLAAGLVGVIVQLQRYFTQPSAPS